MPDGRAIHRWLIRGWYRQDASPLLAPLAWLFLAFTSLRRLAYRCSLLASHHPGVPVVVVGNLTAGGTGKTPLVIWIAQQLRARGIHAGVVLRGYGGRAREPQQVNADSDAAEVGDEAVLIARRTGCPVAIGRRRVAAARLLAAAGCEVIISDDGLQHLAMQRDLEIVVIDGARGFGNGALLPQGPLREAPARLIDVDAIVINGSDSTGIATQVRQPLLMSMAVEKLRAVATEREIPLQSLRGAEVHAVAGIGNPERFFALLRSLGCRVVEHDFADHHAFTAVDIAFPDNLPIVMTDKDAVKCRAFATPRMQYLQVSATLSDADAARLLQLAQGCIGKGGA